MKVKPNHPLQELLGKLLFGIEVVPVAEQRRMVNRACKEAVKWHESQMGTIRRWVKGFEYNVRHIVLDEGSCEIECPQCEAVFDIYGHDEDCELKAMVVLDHDE